MSANVEVVMPNSDDRKSFLRGLPTAAKVVSTPSDRDNVDRIVVAGVESFESMSGVDLISSIRASQKNFSVVFFVASNSKNSPEEITLFQNIAIAFSQPDEPAFVAPDEDTVARIVRAHLASAEKALIATARIEKDQLWVWSCEPKLYRCQISLLPPLRGLITTRLAKFEISKSGSRLHWPDLDIDLTLESIQAAADPVARASQGRQYRKAAKSYAHAIRVLREKHGLAQSAVAGLSDRAVRRVEQGERIPHLATLEKLAKAHGMVVAEYMHELAALSASESRTKKPRR